MKKLCVVMVLIAGLLWGTIGIFVRRYEALGLNSMQIVALRIILAAVIFSLFILLYDRRLFHFKWRDIWCFLGTGIVSLLTFSFCYFRSIELSSLSVASVLLYTAPAFVMIFSLIFFKDKLTIPKIISLVLAILGCAFTTGVITGAHTVTIPGLLFGIGSGVCYALYSIFSRFALDRGYSPFTITLYTLIFAGVAVVFCCDLRPVAKVVFSSAPSFLFALLFSAASCVLPYLTYTLGLSGIRPGTASIVATVEPVMATVIGAVCFDEAVGVPFGYLGILLVLSSVVLINLPIGRRYAAGTP